MASRVCIKCVTCSIKKPRLGGARDTVSESPDLAGPDSNVKMADEASNIEQLVVWSVCKSALLPSHSCCMSSSYVHHSEAVCMVETSPLYFCRTESSSSPAAVANPRRAAQRGGEGQIVALVWEHGAYNQGSLVRTWHKKVKIVTGTFQTQSSHLRHLGKCCMAFMSFLCSMQYVDQYALVAGNAATRADHRNHTRPPMTLRETCIVYATWKDCKDDNASVSNRQCSEHRCPALVSGSDSAWGKFGAEIH